MGRDESVDGRCLDVDDAAVCAHCGAELDGEGGCWRCELEDEQDAYDAASGLL